MVFPSCKILFAGGYLTVTWTCRQVTPLAPASYEILNFNKNATKVWKIVGDVPAAALPMVVTLTKVCMQCVKLN